MGPHDPTLAEWISCAPFEQLLHMQIVTAHNGEAVLTMPFLYEYAQGAGLMHGGALVSLADTALVMAIKSILPIDTHFATIELTAKYHRGVTQGKITAEAKLTDHEGHRINGKAGILDESGQLVMEFDAVFQLSRKTDMSNVAFDRIGPSST
tara:strand:+ start:9019 stop:9474 length:456 start_codon:yes stop_codon:yes gene_type:complete